MQITIRSGKDRTFIPQCEAKKIQPLAGYLMETNDAGLFSIDCQTKTAFERCFDPLPKTLALIAGKHDEVVGVTHQFRLGPMGRSV